MIKDYKVKVCGITEEKNYFDLSKYPIDYFGFIFYKKSPRYILNNPDHFFIKNIKNKVAVFVNEDIDTVIRILEKYNFSYIQLHGDENVDYCMKLKKKGIKNKTYSTVYLEVQELKVSTDYLPFTHYQVGGDQKMTLLPLEETVIYVVGYLDPILLTYNADVANPPRGRTMLFSLIIRDSVGENLEQYGEHWTTPR